MCLIASVCFFTAENCIEKYSTVLLNRPPWEMGAARKRTFSTSHISARLSQRLRFWTTNGLRHHLRSPEGIVSGQKQFLHYLRITTTLMQVFQCFGRLVDLQDSIAHSSQASGIVSRRRERQGNLTSLVNKSSQRHAWDRVEETTQAQRS